MSRIATLLLMLAFGFSATAQLSVTPGDTTICAGQSITYTASGMTLMGWVDSLNQDSTSSATYTFSTDSIGTFGLLAVGVTLIPLDTDTVVVEVTVTAGLSVDISNLGDDTICSGESVTLVASPSGADMYSWSPSGSLSNDTADSVDAMPMTNTMYYVTVQDSTGCSGMDSAYIMVNANPTVTASPSTASICNGESTTLSAASSTAISYLWTPGASVDNDTAMSVEATPTSDTRYYVMVTDMNGCMGMDSADVMVNANPIVTISSDDAGGFVCSGDDVTMTAVASGIASYLWSPDSSLNDTTSMTVIGSPTAATTYMVMVTDTNGCMGSASKFIQVGQSAPFLSVESDPENGVICSGSSAELSTVSNGVSYLWSPSSSLSSSTGATVTASPTSTTTYTVTATLQGCTSTAQFEVSVLDGPSLTYTQSSGGSAICLDESDVVTISCATCDYFEWTLPSGTVTSYSLVQSLSPDVVGVNVIPVVAYDTGGCTTNESVTVTVNDCFIGTPFGIENTTALEASIIANNEVISISSPSVITSVSVYNLLGEKVVERMIAGENTAVISTSAFESGIYIVNVVSANVQTTKKVLLH